MPRHELTEKTFDLSANECLFKKDPHDIIKKEHAITLVLEIVQLLESVESLRPSTKHTKDSCSFKIFFLSMD